MGILDWLNEGIGSNMGGSSMPMPPQGSDPMTAGGIPPDNNGLPSSPPTPPSTDPMTSDIAGGMQGGGLDSRNVIKLAGGTIYTRQGLNKIYSPPPLPTPRPPEANAGPAALPPAAAPTSGTGMPHGPPTSLLPPNMAPPTAPSGFRQNGVGPLGRALGLDANRAREVSGSLASGLKSVGDNWNKPGLAALSGSAGSALEGGNTASDKTEDKQLKYLQQAIVEAKAGNENALNIARTKLALAQAKTAEEGDPEKTALTVARTRESTARARKLEEGGGTGSSVVNSPEQLYLRAVGATNSDGKLSLLKNAYIQASKDGQQDTPAAKAAKTAYEKAYDETRDGHLKTLGVDPKIASKIGKQAGFSADNPIPSAGLTKEKFDQLPVGAYFVNPKDQRLLIKQPPAGANLPAPAQSAAPAAAAPPVPVTAPAGSAADQEDGE